MGRLAGETFTSTRRCARGYGCVVWCIFGMNLKSNMANTRWRLVFYSWMHADFLWQATAYGWDRGHSGIRSEALQRQETFLQWALLVLQNYSLWIHAHDLSSWHHFLKESWSYDQSTGSSCQTVSNISYQLSSFGENKVINNLIWKWHKYLHWLSFYSWSAHPFFFCTIPTHLLWKQKWNLSCVYTACITDVSEWRHPLKPHAQGGFGLSSIAFTYLLSGTVGSLYSEYNSPV